MDGKISWTFFVQLMQCLFHYAHREGIKWRNSFPSFGIGKLRIFIDVVVISFSYLDGRDETHYIVLHDWFHRLYFCSFALRFLTDTCDILPAFSTVNIIHSRFFSLRNQHRRWILLKLQHHQLAWWSIHLLDWPVWHFYMEYMGRYLQFFNFYVLVHDDIFEESIARNPRRKQWIRFMENTRWWN